MNPLRILLDYWRLNWRRDHWSPRRIEAWQRRACRRLLRFARKHSPFYRDCCPDVPEADFTRLPTISKAIMMANFDALNTAGLRLEAVMAWALAKEQAHDYSGYFQERFVVGLSSGTSGNKGIYVTPRALTRRLPGVFLARGGVSLADLPLRILFILRVFSQGFADIRAPGIQLHYLPSMTEPDAIAAVFREKRSNILMAPPSLLRQLLPISHEFEPPPKRIICYAEVLEPEEKARLSAAFRAPVVEIYQASEGQIASPCRAGSLHINEDLVYVELLDEAGKPVRQPGQASRRMLVTNLVNRVQPLIRYEMNDIIELGPRCACGSHFRVISRVIGRQDDVLFLRTRSGTQRAVFPDLVSRWIITTDDRIREFLVRQTAPDHLVLTIDLVPEPTDDPEPGTADVRSRLADRLRQELAEFDIDCQVTILAQPIRLPEDNRKLRRFSRDPA